MSELGKIDWKPVFNHRRWADVLDALLSAFEGLGLESYAVQHDRKLDGLFEVAFAATWAGPVLDVEGEEIYVGLDLAGSPMGRNIFEAEDAPSWFYEVMLGGRPVAISIGHRSISAVLDVGGGPAHALKVFFASESGGDDGKDVLFSGTVLVSVHFDEHPADSTGGVYVIPALRQQFIDWRGDEPDGELLL